MITTIIFSKNRACQLDLLLRSIEKNFSHISTDIRVLFCATTDEFMHGYDIIEQRFPNVKFTLEFDFQDDTLKLLNNCKDYTCFFVDDNIVYRKPEVDAHGIKQLFENIEQVGCFSFRLGLNTVIQDMYSEQRVHPWPIMERINMYNEYDVLLWSWRSVPPNNFGYPFSVDGHVYDKEMVINALDYEFITPNALEGRFPMKQVPPVMMCLDQSSVFNNSINLVGSSNNNAGKFYPHSLEELNQAYLDGKQINLDHICNNDIVGCHQEVKITLGDYK